MPFYTMRCAGDGNQHDTLMRLMISERDNEFTCEEHGDVLKRQIDFQGAVYAPTSSNGTTIR